MRKGLVASERANCTVPHCLNVIWVPSNLNLPSVGAFLCKHHGRIIIQLQQDLDHLSSIEETVTALKKEIKLLQEEKLQLIEAREDKVYLVKEKLEKWKELLESRLK